MPTLQITSAGNKFGADACTQSPASNPQAIAVASSTQQDTLSSFSNLGSCVDVSWGAQRVAKQAQGVVAHDACTCCHPPLRRCQPFLPTCRVPHTFAILLHRRQHCKLNVPLSWNCALPADFRTRIFYPLSWHHVGCGNRNYERYKHGQREHRGPAGCMAARRALRPGWLCDAAFPEPRRISSPAPLTQSCPCLQPHTAGVVALLLQAYPTATVADLSRRLVAASQQITFDSSLCFTPPRCEQRALHLANKVHRVPASSSG